MPPTLLGTAWKVAVKSKVTELPQSKFAMDAGLTVKSIPVTWKGTSEGGEGVGVGCTVGVGCAVGVGAVEIPCGVGVFDGEVVVPACDVGVFDGEVVEVPCDVWVFEEEVVEVPCDV